MNQKRWRTGLIGCGAIGSRYDEGKGAANPIFTHAGMFSALPQFELACIAEIDPARREICRSAWSVPAAYGDHREMLRRECLDVIGLAVPDDVHAPVLNDILDCSRPKAIFTEKPLTKNSAEALAIGARCEAAGVALLVDYVRRYDANHRALRNFLSRGGLGRIHTVHAQYVRGILHNGCQIVNLLRFLLGEPVRVCAFGLTQGSIPGDPSLDLRLTFGSGAMALISAMDRNGYFYSVFELEIAGDKGRLHLDATGRDIRMELVVPYDEFQGFSRLAPSPSPWTKETYGEAMLTAGQEISRAADGDLANLENSWREAMRDMEVIEAAMASAAQNGAAVNLDL